LRRSTSAPARAGVVARPTGGYAAVGGKHRKPPWWRRARQAPQPPHLTELVDSDGTAHYGTDDAFEEGWREGSGYYWVLCGKRVAVASMLTPPERFCRNCDTLRRVRWA